VNYRLKTPLVKYASIIVPSAQIHQIVYALILVTLYALILIDCITILADLHVYTYSLPVNSEKNLTKRFFEFLV